MRRQCALLAVTRSSVYEPVVPDAEELALMRRIDELHLQHPFFGQPDDHADVEGRGPRDQSESASNA